MHVTHLLRRFSEILDKKHKPYHELWRCIDQVKKSTGEGINAPCWSDELIVEPVFYALCRLLDAGRISILDISDCFEALQEHATSVSWVEQRIVELRGQWAASKGYPAAVSDVYAVSEDCVPKPLSIESDPNGIDAHSPGAKLDAGKIRCALVIGGFSAALWQVSRVGTFGAAKYTPNGWKEVEGGIDRYTDAMARHLLAEAMGEEFDSESKLLHAAHAAWNALARLELILRERADG